MNLLRIQDALKNASDQQLMALMQAPDSTAPSYLVLSEIRRRKEMRAKQAPEQTSNRTVAEELTAPEEPAGIRALGGTTDPDGVDAAEGGDVQGMAAGGLASLRRYAEGGVVRMQAGGQPPFPLIPTGTDLDRDLAERARIARQNDEIRMRGAALQRQSGVISDAMADVRAQIDAGVPPEEAINSTLNAPSFRGRVTREQLPLSIFNPAGLPAPPAVQPAPTQPAAPQETRPIVPPSSSNRTDIEGGGQENPPGGNRANTGQGAEGNQTRAVPGLDGLRNAPTGIPDGGRLPTMAELMQQNAALFPDGMGGIRERMREERVDPAARRNEAINMALIEAGLRIAGSRNPSLAGAIGEGAVPAVQSYSQQLGQIRAEQRQARQDELELAKQETNRQFAIGQISAAEYRSRMENINANLRVAAQERGANARLAASESAADRRAAEARAAAEAADRRRGFITQEEYSRMSPEQREQFREFRGIGRPADVGGAASTLAATNRELQNLRTRLSDLGPEPPRTTGIWGRDNPAYARWQQESASIRAQIADAEALRRSMEEVLRVGRGAQTGSGAGGQSVLNYDPETRTLR